MKKLKEAWYFLGMIISISLLARSAEEKKGGP